MLSPGAGEDALIRVTRGPLVSTVSVRFQGLDVVVQLFGGGGEGEAATSEIGGHIAVTSTVGLDNSNLELVCVLSCDTLAKDASNPSSVGTQREFYTHSGLDFIRRVTKDGNQAANFYPMVLGARMMASAASGGGAPSKGYTVISGHSMAAGSQRDGELELMMHRSLAQDDGRGLSEPVNDNSKVEVPLWITFDTFSSDFDFRVRSIRLNNPLRAFSKVPSSASGGSSGGGEGEAAFMAQDHVSSPVEWKKRQHVTLQPLRAPLPPSVHLLSLLARDSVSDDVVVRFQHLQSKSEGGSAWVGSLGTFLSGDTYRADEVRRATLSLNSVMPLGASHPKRTMNFPKALDAVSSPYDTLPSGAGAGGAAGAKDSQNTNEEGVFLSQSALEKLRQDQERAAAAAAAAAAPGARSLLQQQMEQEPDMVDVRGALTLPSPSSSSSSSPSKLSPFVSPAASARHLLASPSSSSPSSSSSSSPSSPSSAPLFVLKPLQIHTYIFRLSGVEDSVEDSTTPSRGGVVVKPTVVKQPVAAVEEPDDVEVPKPVVVVAPPLPITLPREEEPQTPARPVVHHPVGPAGPAAAAGGVAMGAGAGVGGGASNVLQGHEHTVIPGRSRDAWRLIPSRLEYLVVLLASLVGVAFFLQALRVMARGTAVDLLLLPGGAGTTNASGSHAAAATRPAARIKHAAH